jgi:hypothetical protein
MRRARVISMNSALSTSHDAFLRARVVDEAEIVKHAVDRDAGLFQRLAARGRFERLVFIGRTFRDAPRRAPVVVAGRMNEQDLERVVARPVEHDAGRQLRARLGHSRTVQDEARQCKRAEADSCSVDRMSDQRKAWFAKVVESGLQNQIFNASDVLAHATPDVLATNLPAELLSKILAASLAAGAMTPERVLETLTPELMAAHLPHDVLWACIAAAATRAGVSAGTR